ncbi:MAG: family 78 glycoside hydrolase catalytic domain [Clostridia bacterium]|nr:family 78 glycoside hydrolase catalytic domain [Clostridia bacterium]
MEQTHAFLGKWITDGEFAELLPRNVFHRQKDELVLPEEHLNAHVLFRGEFTLENLTRPATIYISADDYYKLYVNGRLVCMGPALAYHSRYGYNTVDVSNYLQIGKNTVAVHTLYQGLINRVWQSGDFRHGLIFDLFVGEECVLKSDGSILTARHTAYTPTGRCGYDTQFLERYDSREEICNFASADYDCTHWEGARLALYADHTLIPQETKMLDFEQLEPKFVRRTERGFVYDFGEIYVGYLLVSARGKSGDTVTVRCAQELCEDGSLRYALRANCDYSEEWILSGAKDTLDQFDYKSFRYAELIIPDGTEILSCSLLARHYPFTLCTRLKPKYENNEKIKKVWRLAVNSQKYGAQEAILDCMEREKGFYVGDACYTVLAHSILTGEDGIARKLINDAFHSTFITDTTVICLGCSFMQEIAEYPLMLVQFILWHYRLFGDREYLSQVYPKAVKLVETYRREYENAEHLVSVYDKWSVVEWPPNYRDGYDVDLSQGHSCRTVHISDFAYYVEAVHTLNLMARILGLPDYRDESVLRSAFNSAFYDSEKGMYRDSNETEHISIVGNVFPYAFGLCDDARFYENMEDLVEKRGISALSLFTSFPLLMGLVRRKNYDLLERQLLDDGAWLRIISEDSYTTFEGWGRECKWNTSLFHMTMSDVAVFLADIDTDALFER